MQEKMKFEDKMIDGYIETTENEFNKVEYNISNGIALFGAGQYGEACLEYLLKNKYMVKCFIDNSPSKQGKSIQNIPIVSMNHELVKDTVVLITAKHSVLEIKRNLNGLINISFDAWFVIKNIDKYNEMKDFFKDEYSKNVLNGVLLAMLTGNEKYSSMICDTDQYFCLSEFTNKGREVFVDAGAYTGDTIEKFIFKQNGGFKKIFAFEPGKKQFYALKTRMKRLINEWAIEKTKIKLFNAALGSTHFKTFISNPDELYQSSIINHQSYKKTDEVDVFAIDDILKDENISFIKADIEGSEVSMLEGAKETIKKNKPKLALSVYHKPDDLFEICRICYNYCSEYKMVLRHHSPMLVDTTLYCYIEE